MSIPLGWGHRGQGCLCLGHRGGSLGQADGSSWFGVGLHPGLGGECVDVWEGGVLDVGHVHGEDGMGIFSDPVQWAVKRGLQGQKGR